MFYEYSFTYYGKEELVMKKKRKNTAAVHNTTGNLIRSLVCGAGIGVVVWTLLLFVSALILSKLSEPELFIMPVVFVQAAFASFFASFASSRMSGLRSAVPGLITGAVLIFAVTAISLACAGNSGEVSGMLKILLCVDFLMFSLIGAKFAAPSPKRKKRARK